MHDSEAHKQVPPRLRRLGLGALALAIVVAALGVASRSRSETALQRWTTRQATPNVSIVEPQRGVGAQELVLPAQIEANYEAPIHARVSGYLKMWYQDIGAHVKAGQLLALIDAPDLDQQLQQAQANLASARASAALAQLTAKRWQASTVARAVSQQTVDEKVDDARAAQAQAQAAEANVGRLEVLEGFKRIVAPFDGIVTARKTDIGALIDASDDGGQNLFSVADIHRMRVYVRVPQAYAAMLTSGMTATLRLPQFPTQTFTARLDTTSNAIDPGSRTVLAEFFAANPKDQLWPGTYAEAHLQIPASPWILHLPTSALIFQQDGLEVAVLNADDTVTLKHVTLGRDLGTQVEVLRGISAGDKVIDSPPDSLQSGDSVRVDAATSSGPYVARN